MSESTGQIKPVYAIASADRFLRSESLTAVVSQIGEEGNAPARYDGPSANLAEVLDEARTFSLLGGRNVVIVEDADKFITQNRAALERYCEKPADSGTLILLCKSMPKNTKLYKIIAKSGQVIIREPMNARAIVGWAVDRAKQMYGKRLGNAAAHRLREHIGDSAGSIDAELSKLSSYVGERGEITTDDIAELTGQLREEKSFAVLDAIANGDAGSALALWTQTLATDRAAPALAIGGLSFGVRRLLEARIEYDNGVSAGVLSRRLFASPDVVERRLRRCNPDALREMQRDLLAVDLAVKTGGSTVAVAIEKFIVTHTSRGTKPRVKAG